MDKMWSLLPQVVMLAKGRFRYPLRSSASLLSDRLPPLPWGVRGLRPWVILRVETKLGRIARAKVMNVRGWPGASWSSVRAIAMRMRECWRVDKKMRYRCPLWAERLSA